MFSVWSSEDDILWSYLSSHNNWKAIKRWLFQVGDEPERSPISPNPLPNVQFPSLTSETKMKLDASTVYVTERLKNMLVRQGFFYDTLLDDFSQLFCHLRETGMLLLNGHPVQRMRKEMSPENRLELQKDFDGQFLKFCMANGLKMLAWYFVKWHKLVIQFCSPLSIVPFPLLHYQVLLES